jgi:hypothetical protein
LAKIGGLGVATVALCASVVLASVIAQRRDRIHAHHPLPDLQITGARALLPKELTRAAPLVTATAVPDLPDPVPHQPAGSSPKDSAPAKTELVKRFYQLVLTRPDEAFELLDTRLPDRDVSTFVQSWDTVAELEVLDVRERGIDVLAVIRLRLTDGSRLHVRQSLEVSDAEPQRIMGAQILTVRRMAK